MATPTTRPQTNHLKLTLMHCIRFCLDDISVYLNKNENKKSLPEYLKKKNGLLLCKYLYVCIEMCMGGNA